MKRAAIVAILAACGSKPAPKGPEHDLDVATHEDVKPTPKADAVTKLPAAIPALAGDGPHAFVADSSGLIEIAPDGKTQAIAPARPGWCSADARANVVWFTGDDGLYAFDLGDRRVHPIVHGQLDLDTVAIEYDNEQLGGEDKLDYQVALAIHMTTPPTASSELGCDGDQADYCYEDDGKTLRAELVEKQKKLDAAAIVDTSYVGGLVTRAKGRSLWTPPPVPPVAPKKPKVAKKPCEETPGNCGALTAIPGSALWLVQTANSRGDFYHETRELWDPADGAFVWVANGKVVRSVKPQLGESDYRDLRIAPSGGLMSINGVVFDPSHVVYAPPADDLALTCGWSSGGWRIKSPTE